MDLFLAAGQRAMTVSIQLYTKHHAIIPCDIWCVMMQGYYDMWEASSFDNAMPFPLVDAKTLMPAQNLAEIMSLPYDHPVSAKFADVASKRPMLLLTAGGSDP